MNDPDKQLHDEGSRIRLLASEKEALRRRILNAPARRWTVSGYLRRVHRPLTISAAAFAVFVATGISLASAAQLSVPGDLLHGMEIRLIEEIEWAIRVSPEARAAYSAERLEERLAELKTAQKKEKELAADEFSETGENVQRHAEAILETSQGVDQLVKASALLNAHEEVFTEARVESGVVEDAGDALAAKLREEAAEYALSQKPQELVEEILEEIAEVESTLLTADYGSDAEEDIANHLEEVEDSVQEGDLQGAFTAAVETKVRVLAEEYTEDPAGNVVTPQE